MYTGIGKLHLGILNGTAKKPTKQRLAGVHDGHKHLIRQAIRGSWQHGWAAFLGSPDDASYSSLDTDVMMGVFGQALISLVLKLSMTSCHHHLQCCF